MPLSTRGAAAASDAVSIRNRCSPPAVLVSQLREHRQILDAWDGRVMQYEQVPSCAGASCFVGKPPELVLAHFSVMKSRNGCIENQHAQAVTSAEIMDFAYRRKVATSYGHLVLSVHGLSWPVSSVEQVLAFTLGRPSGQQSPPSHEDNGHQCGRLQLITSRSSIRGQQ
jgi:hypothetical protein